MKTTTAVYTDQAVSATAGINAGAVKIDLNALSVNDATLHATVLTHASVPSGPGTGQYPTVGNKLMLTIHYAFSTVSYDPSVVNVPLILGQSAQEIQCAVPNTVATTRVISTDRITLRSRYLYVWYSLSDASASAMVLNMQVVT